MGLSKFQVSVAADSTLPRDKIVNTFHLDVADITPDYDALCQDAAAGFASSWYGTTRQIEVKAYDIGAAPNFPKGRGIVNEGQNAVSGGPREVAICLSYYGDRNLPRTRGRIYLAANSSSHTASSVRPSGPYLDFVIGVGQMLADLGGVDVDWCWYSPTSGEHGPVKTCYADDEWDTIRSRGLRPTDRHVLAVNE